MREPVPEYRPIRSRARAAKICVGLCALVGIFSATSDVLADVLGFPDWHRAGPYSAFDSVSTQINVAASLAGAVAFLAWLRRALLNAEAREIQLSFSRGMATAAWFIPFVSLVLPYQHMAELDRATAGQDAGRPSALDLKLWWGFWVGGTLTVTAGGLLTPVTVTMTFASELLQVGAAIMILRVIDRITHRLEGESGPVEF